MVIKDHKENILKEGDVVCFHNPEVISTGKISKIAVILQPGPMNKGTIIEIDVKVKMAIPAGHFQIPVHLTKEPDQRFEPEPTSLISQA